MRIQLLDYDHHFLSEDKYVDVLIIGPEKLKNLKIKLSITYKL